MPRLNFKEINSPNSNRGDSDQFEKFCEQFFRSLLKMKITKSPSRGADGGIDLCVEESSNNTKYKWLVSCKHYAHSGRSVGSRQELDITDRMHANSCDGFIGFYSTIQSSGLEQKLEDLRKNYKITYKFYNSENIEEQLLENVPGFLIAKRFFPDSIKNLWPQVISMKETFNISDATKGNGNEWIVESAFNENDIKIWSNSPENAVEYANERAMTEIHRPMFLAAWKDAVKLYPSFFKIPKQGIDKVENYKDLPPNWSATDNLGKLKANQRWMLLAIWSLVDEKKVRDILKKMNRDASQQDLDLMSFQCLARLTATNRRDILTRLFAYY